MDKALHKRIKLVSGIAMILGTLAAFGGILLLKSGRFEFDFVEEEVLISWGVFMIFPLISLLTSFSIYHNGKTYIRLLSKYIFYVYPVILFAAFIVIISLTNTFSVVAVSVMLLFLTTMALMHIFVFSDATNLTSTIGFICLIIVCIILKRFHLNYSGFFIAMVLAMFSMGCFIYGIRCLFLAEKNNYLKYVAFWGSFIITIFFMALLWKMQHWPLGNFLMYSSILLLPLATIIFLLTLPSSGFIEWKTLHKKILFRLLLPWTLIFLLFIIRYLLPEVDKIIWTKDVTRVRNSFDMPDYTIELKNNLEDQ